MVLEQQMLHLDLEDRRPVHFAKIITPPEEFDENPQDQGLKRPSPNMSQVSDDRWASIYRHTPTPTLILDGSLKVVETSESHQALLNHTREQVLGITIYELTPSLAPAPNIASLSGALGAAIATRKAQVIPRVRAAGRTYSLRVTPIFASNVLINVLLEAHEQKEDVTEPYMSEQAYLNETYKILINTVKDYAIFMLDTRGHIATWNSGAGILKGYTSQEIIGQHFSIFYGSDDRQANKPAKELEVCMREGKVEDEGWRYRKDGRRFWANVMITAIYQFGIHVGFVKVTRDLTERKAAEARLIDAFEESSKLKTDFLANMSHELRTPMNGMFLALSMLMRTPLADDQREYASILEDSTSILLQVINDVLDYSKLSSGSFSLNTDVLNIPTVINAVIQNCKATVKPGVVLKTSIASDFPQNTRGDPLRFRQVLQNLIGNAVKFTEEGYIHINASYVQDPVDPRSYDISIQVVDSGIGIPETAGTGLGLSICKSLAELMDGAVGFHSNPDGPGSVFWVSTKMIDSPISQTRDPRPSIRPTSQDSTELLRKIAPQKHLLLVEDNKVNQTIMLKLLTTLGFEQVDVAWDGAEAVRMVKQKPLAYNVILMDINMPVMDGMQATERIRQMNIDVPIIALTGNALKGDAETYLAKGMNDYIAKPLHRHQLVELLWKWCGS